MTVFKKARVARRLLAACAVAMAVGGGLGLAAAPAESIRLVGVSTQATGKTAAVLIESSEPVAYTVSRPDALTVLLDLRNLRVGDAAAQAAKAGLVAGVTLEQATSDDGGSLARVRVALESPSAYTVKSARNVIRLDLQPEAARAEAPVAAPASVENTTTVAATLLNKVRANQTKAATTITLAGNGRLTPSSLTESDDQPRRLVLDFPNVSPAAPARTGVDSAFVKQVRVALNSRAPLVTRVVMEISPAAAYHVERTGPDGRDLAVVFEGRRAGGAVMVAPPTGATPQSAGKDEDETITLAQAIANAESITPKDPITALAMPSRIVSQPAPTALALARQSTQPPSAPPAQPPPPAPPAVQPPPAPQPASQPAPRQPPPFNVEVPGSGQKQFTGHPINFDFEDADLRAVLRVFANESGLNMIIDPQLQGRVNVLLNDVPWDQALDQILRPHKLDHTVDAHILRIAPIAVLSAEKKEQADYQTQQALAGELRVQTFNLSYAKAGDLSPILTKSVLSARGQIQVDPRTNMLIIQDLPDRLAPPASLISTLDLPQPQVEVEARVAPSNPDLARAIGIPM